MEVQARKKDVQTFDQRSVICSATEDQGLGRSQEETNFNQGFGSTFTNQRCIRRELQKLIEEFSEVWEDGLVRHSIVHLTTGRTSVGTSETS